MLKKLFIPLITSATLLVAEQSYTDQLKQFQQYKQSQESAFEQYKAAQQKAFEDYKKELGVFWDDPKLSNKTQWISYTKDKKTRTDVDFKNETIKIETLASSEKEAKAKINVALAKAVTLDTKKAYELDPLQNRLEKIAKPKNVVGAKPDAKPILANIVFTKPPEKKDVVDYVDKNTKNIQVKTSKKQKKVYFVEVKLPKNTTYKRSRTYLNDVVKNSKRQDVSLALIFAIMHSESSFNPMARSHVPAYGLMQIVPRTAGIDAYNYLYKQKRLVSGSYLYNSQNNIELGSAYLHILYYQYLKHIKNPQSRLYCTIAAYNTGAGNVARAFVRSNSVPSAAKVINKLTPNEVYNRLLRDLKYDEPKHYLKRVTKRMKVYEEVYQGS
ncbi:transglycosylase SLT domain-containing protein [Sulfurimonas microaerophilic]|uniref:transglycosylase SLT domain-containing protein n=1 Tax=Sulfurimonas microaerophilic TaxID=3058392 RepID=UPI0027155C1B|nr:murein transglycosylase domain-containing protein [Sulfurimonas sp. hsl 1-7]